MVRNDVMNTVGTAVLLAAAPAGRGRAMDAASALPVLAAVPAGVLAGTHMATVVELADPLDPQSVLTRLRAAAATPGPLALYLAGQLQLDRRQRLPHLALARSTPSTLRYTGLPWHWLAGELAPRRQGTTTVVADLAVDPELWQRLGDTPDTLQLGPAVALFAHLTPFPRRGVLLTPDYLRHFATTWRAGVRPPLPLLHEEAAAAARAAGHEGAILLSPGLPGGAFGAAQTADTRAIGGAPGPSAPPALDTHPGAGPAGGPGAPDAGPGAWSGAPGGSPAGPDARARSEQPRGPGPYGQEAAGPAPAPPAGRADATHTRTPAEATGPHGVSHPPAPGAPEAPRPPHDRERTTQPTGSADARETTPEPAAATPSIPSTPSAPAGPVVPAPSVPPVPAPPRDAGAPAVNGPAQASEPPGSESPAPATPVAPAAAAGPEGTALRTGSRTSPPPPPSAPGTGLPPRPPHMPAEPPADRPPTPGSGIDPHPAILAAARSGRHGEAAAMAAAWESDALRRYGPRSSEAVHWVEVRADLARLAGEPARSCELWITAAQARLGLRQSPDEPDVEGAVDRAHHQWEQIADPDRARALGPALIELRRRVPGRHAGALAALRRKMG
ncbi:hypothetical protein ACGFRB_03555 [Streptomyces sp. NPDC048718]|uniref:hypothetical protein n=1 Tax=Streptomyces sp. NPDC048718 TaxID=3365587 RepID=UPI003714593F